MSINVALITPLFIPVRGGTEVHVYNLAKALIKRGVEVKIYTTRNTYTEKGILKPREVLDSIQVERGKMVWRKGRHDLYHFHNLGRVTSLWNLYTLVRAPRDRSLFTPHHIMTLDKGFLGNVYYRALWNKFRKVIAVSEWEKEEMAKRGFSPEKVVVIPNGVEEEAYSLPVERVSQGDPYLVYLGRIYRPKGQHLALQALKGLEGVRIVFVGQIHDPYYYQELREQASSLGDRVEFRLDVTQREKYSLIDNSLALVLMSEVEAEGIAVKEAMARGKPVIVRNSSALPYTVRHMENGLVVEDVISLREAVRLLLEDRELYDRISQNNRERAKEWKWDHVADRILRVYEEMTSPQS